MTHAPKLAPDVALLRARARWCAEVAAATDELAPTASGADGAALETLGRAFRAAAGALIQCAGDVEAINEREVSLGQIMGSARQRAQADQQQLDVNLVEQTSLRLARDIDQGRLVAQRRCSASLAAASSTGEQAVSCAAAVVEVLHSLRRRVLEEAAGGAAAGSPGGRPSFDV